ncbi:MAG TPA: FAD-dependent oxidoreductase [Candidatus Hydrogenedentes bacterium]|nr:FAD-dependent oxidoreductase [Candidatus Hydrogenedentota bacterium]
MRLSSLDAFHRFQSSLSDAHDTKGATIVIPAGTCGRASGADALIRAVREEVLRNGFADQVRVRVTGCHGFCEMEPSLLIEPAGTFYPKVDVADAERIVKATARGEIVEEFVWLDPVSGKPVPRQNDVPFFSKQLRTILSRNELVDPLHVETYIAHGGYAALVKALEMGDPNWVLQEIKASGLRGRGGAGFPTGLKWELLAKQPNDRGKYLVCNADEGDPGAYMDRSVLEGNPHSILEGMMLGAFATGATEGIMYIRNEYPLAIKHVLSALEQARELGLLGQDILGTGRAFDIQVIQGAGAFVCGEETALIHSIEGKMGEPRQRPPFPIQSGINGRPTAINNVETWANIPVIIAGGAKAFAQTGTPGNSGTKIFSLVGKIKNTGLVEVPMGTTINTIVYEIGGGPAAKARIKAVQTGGPSGGSIPAHMFDLPIDYDSLAKAGSIMGSGGMIVMDENTCMVDIAKYFMGFLKSESCGKCFTCRKGTQRMYELLDDISSGRGTLAHINLLEELALTVRDTTMCGLGQTAANPVLSMLRHFREECRRHVTEKRCDAFVCGELVGAACQMACPLETPPWRYVALIEKGRYEEAYQVIRDANPFPAVSARVCDRKCERRCKLGTTGGEPVAIRALKRFVTDRIDTSAYRPVSRPLGEDQAANVAVVGAGPAGLSAAHYLSLLGHNVTVFEAEKTPGGMLTSCIPAYRLPRDIVHQEIETLTGDSVTLKCGVTLGRDMTIDSLFEEGFQAVFLAMGADKSWHLGLEGEHLDGIHSSMAFLKAFNLNGEELAHGRVAIIGGGNSAVDAARVAIRQKGVESVTLLYRRTCGEMPAYAEEVDAAIEEGIRLETLVSPVRIRYIDTAMKEGVQVETLVHPVKIYAQDGQLSGIDCVRNTLGDIDASGRGRPVPLPGTEFHLPLDTLIVAIGERPDSECLAGMGINIEKDGRVALDPDTLCTSRPGVFAGGDLATGPNTVVDAIAAGRKAAGIIDRYLRGADDLREPVHSNLPRGFLEPSAVEAGPTETAERIEPPTIPLDARKDCFAEVEMAYDEATARREAHRCLRCDLRFTRMKDDVSSAACAGAERERV